MNVIFRVSLSDSVVTLKSFGDSNYSEVGWRKKRQNVVKETEITFRDAEISFPSARDATGIWDVGCNG